MTWGGFVKERLADTVVKALLAVGDYQHGVMEVIWRDEACNVRNIICNKQ